MSCMSNFCLIAFIPSILLVIWLLIEVRKYVLVNKNYRSAEHAWRKDQELKSHYYSDNELVQSIPPKPSSRVYARGLGEGYDGDETAGSKEHSDFLDYEVDDGYRPDYGYDYNYEYAPEGRMEVSPGGRRGKRKPVYDDYTADDYYSSSYEQEEYDYPIKRIKRSKSSRRRRPEKQMRDQREQNKKKRKRTKRTKRISGLYRV